MKKSDSGPELVDAYIQRYPPDVQRILKKLRATIRQAAPKAVEKISYGMPAFHQDGMLVWYAAHRSHIGFYPKGASAIVAFQKQLARYKTSKGAIQFPLDEPIPYELVRKIVKYRLAENRRGSRAAK